METSSKSLVTQFIAAQLRNLKDVNINDTTHWGLQIRKFIIYIFTYSFEITGL